ncbi:DUF4232 domain-containing protein [Streptomyces sp. 7-21]|jgi:hypothetical protein|uniref:DUF4232 domain-containing protein n=1 Tax=Streptomyces sp. 7-21 TaxID=2802283 RepID=UPI00191DB6A1|nr:DUF4232 domain-containing protein [Streptomyces sp. 7-21]MBL1067460.1 DUF4232 domain-containing protein [Streptomyces sp. 7-21]
MRLVRIAATALSTSALVLALGACNEEEATGSQGGGSQEQSQEQGSQDQDQSGQEDQGGQEDQSEDQGSQEDQGGSGDDGAQAGGACTPGMVTITAESVSRPVNHMLLTATNTSDEPCSLYEYPLVALSSDPEAPLPEPIEESKPQAVVTLQPGEAGYAVVGSSSADGSGSGQTTDYMNVTLIDDSGTGTGEAVELDVPGGEVYVEPGNAYVSYWLSDPEDALTW